MWPVIVTVLRTYAPYVVWPAAAVIGVIGYNIEKVLRGDSDKTPWKPSVIDQSKEIIGK